MESQPADRKNISEGWLTFFELKTKEHWEDFRTELDRENQSAATANILGRLREGGANLAVIENDYIDHDYSEEYWAFYSRLFHRYGKHSRRIHFFADSVGIFKGASIKSIAVELEAASANGAYFGFVVLRPVDDAPVGRTVLKLPEMKGRRFAPGARARHEVHLAGATLRVEGFPFIEQDKRLTACSHASLWICGRHFHTKHGAPWLSPATIASWANEPIDVTNAQSVPIGAGGLHPDSLLRVVKLLDRTPLGFFTERDRKWPMGLSPGAVVTRYVDSGLPVILGIPPKRELKRHIPGHTVVATGLVYGPSGAVQPGERLSSSAFISHFLVHDDQRGPSLSMSVVGEGTTKDDVPPYSLDDIFFMIVPLPDKVFMTGEGAELRAWDFLERHAKDWWPQVKKRRSLKGSRKAGDEFVAAINDKKAVARTYLTLGWKYKKWLIENSASDSLKNAAVLIPLPRMVWVTEFGTIESLDCEEDRKRIFAHCVVDATTTMKGHPPLLMHVMGCVYVWSQKDGFDPDYSVGRTTFENDVPYSPRTRQ